LSVPPCLKPRTSATGQLWSRMKWAGRSLSAIPGYGLPSLFVQRLLSGRRRMSSRSFLLRPGIWHLATLDVDARVERLLQDADATRWLSLASHLSPLAEAAPSAFLNAVEASLRRPDTPVSILFDESASADGPLSGGAWYYADLLRALESLAWSPRWRHRVGATTTPVRPVGRTGRRSKVRLSLPPIA